MPARAMEHGRSHKRMGLSKQLGEGAAIMEHDGRDIGSERGEGIDSDRGGITGNQAGSGGESATHSLWIGRSSGADEQAVYGRTVRSDSIADSESDGASFLDTKLSANDLANFWTDEYAHRCTDGHAHADAHGWNLPRWHSITVGDGC